MNDRADLCLAAASMGFMLGRMISRPKRRGGSSGPTAGWEFPRTIPSNSRKPINFGRLPCHRSRLCDQQQGQSRSCRGTRRGPPGKGTDAQAAGRDRRHYPRQCPFGHRSGRRCRGGDIRLVTGSRANQQRNFCGFWGKVETLLWRGHSVRTPRSAAERVIPAGRNPRPYTELLRRFVSTHVEPPVPAIARQRLGAPQPSRQRTRQRSWPDQRHHAGDGLDDRLGHLHCVRRNFPRGAVARAAHRGVGDYRLPDHCRRASATANWRP